MRLVDADGRANGTSAHANSFKLPYRCAGSRSTNCAKPDAFLTIIIMSLVMKTSMAQFYSWSRGGVVMNRDEVIGEDASSSGRPAKQSGPRENRSPLVGAASIFEDIFRKDAVDGSRRRFGAPIRPIGVTSSALTAFFIIILIAIVIFLMTARYARKETVVGQVTPQGAFKISAQISGKADRVLVNEGQTVKAGEVLDSTLLLEERRHLHFKPQLVLTVCRRQHQQQVGGRHEARLDPGLRGLVAERNGQVRLAHAAWSDQHDVLVALPKPRLSTAIEN